MILRYTRNETKQKENFDFIYNTITQKDFRLLASNNGFDEETIPFASYIVENALQNKLFNVRDFGSFNEKKTKTALRWILDVSFDQYDNFAIIDNKTYNNICDAYYTKEFEKRQKQINIYNKGDQKQ